MAMRISQLAFDRIIGDVEEKVFGLAVDNVHKGLLRSSFQSEVGPLVADMTALAHVQQMEIAKTAHSILRHHCWINLDDPCWEFVVPRMLKHLKDVDSCQLPTAASSEPEPGIPGWAPPRPRSRHVKGVKVPCPLCAEEIIAPLDHLAYQHGIDTPRNQYTTREAHIKKMRQDIVVQHLVQDGAELNRLRGEILDVEGKLKRLDASYRSGHGLPLHVVYEIHRDHPSFALNGESGQTKQALVEKLRNLRLDGLSLGRLYSNSGRGTYSEVLADLKQCLAQREWPPAAAHWDGEKYQHTGNKEDA